MDALRLPAAALRLLLLLLRRRRRRRENLKPSACNQTERDFLPPPSPAAAAMRISSGSFRKENPPRTLGLASHASDVSYVASVRATIGDEGPELPCGLKKKTQGGEVVVVEGEKEKATIASSRLLFEGESGGDLRTSSSTASRRLVSASNRVTSTPNHLAAPFHTHFFTQKTRLLTHSRSSIQVFSHFPLSFHSRSSLRWPSPASRVPLWPLPQSPPSSSRAEGGGRGWVGPLSRGLYLTVIASV